MMKSQVLLLYDEAMLGHDPRPDHPERPARLRAIVEALERNPVTGARIAKPQAATRAQVERMHESRYIDQIESLRGRSVHLDADTAVSPRSVDAAYPAAGAAIDAVEAVVRASPLSLEGEGWGEGGSSALSKFPPSPQPSPLNRETEQAMRAFALVRPPGHHAEADRAMGFCLFNNIAVAAAHAIAELRCARVLIVDWDVHHGNGTQHMFEDRRDVLYFSSHQWPLYPGTGAVDEIGRGEGEGFTVNAPLPAGTDDAGYAALYQRLFVPIADAYKPDLVLVSAGFDSHRADPLAGMRMTENGFAALCRIVREIADRHAGGRLALILEGGYDLDALAGSVRACVEVLAGAVPSPSGEPDSEARRVIDKLCAAHRRFWPV